MVRRPGSGPFASVRWTLDANRAGPNDAAVNAFDGTGPPFKGPTFRAAIAMLVVCLVGVALVWLAYSAALGVLDDRVPSPSDPIVVVP